MLDENNRIKYDDVRGYWRVIFKGRRIRPTFKTSAEAHKYLDDAKKGFIQYPEYE